MGSSSCVSGSTRRAEVGIKLIGHSLKLMIPVQSTKKSKVFLKYFWRQLPTTSHQKFLLKTCNATQRDCCPIHKYALLGRLNVNSGAIYWKIRSSGRDIEVGGDARWPERNSLNFFARTLRKGVTLDCLSIYFRSRNPWMGLRTILMDDPFYARSVVFVVALTLIGRLREDNETTDRKKGQFHTWVHCFALTDNSE